MPRPKKKVVDKNSTSTAVSTGEVESKPEVAGEESTSKQEFIAYMEDLKRRDVHEYSVREVELNNKLKKL